MTSTPTKRSAIRDAAEALMLEGGLSAVSAGAVSARAGVNKALVFYYFASMGELVAEVLSGYYARHESALVDAFESEGSVRERLERFVDRYFDWMVEHRGYARIVQEHVARGGDHAALVSEHTRGLLRVCEAQLAGLLPPEGPMAAKHFYLSLSAAVINYFTYAPLLEEGWGHDPLGPEGLAERRAHLRWIIDAWATQLGL